MAGRGSRSVDRLTREDNRILRLEGPTIAGHTCKVVVIEPSAGHRPPTLAEVRDHVADRLYRVPRCRQRLEYPPLGLGRPAWVDDDQFSIGNHITAAENGRSVDSAGLIDLAAASMTQRLDRRRPLWSMTVVNLDGGRWAIIWSIHHCMADGMTARSWATALLWAEDPVPERQPQWVPGPRPAPSQLLIDGLRRRLPSGGSSSLDGAAASRWRTRWRGAVAMARRLPSTLAREGRPLRGPSLFAAPIGRRRQVAVATCSLDDLHQIARSAAPGITVNDVLLTVVAGAVRSWAIQHAPGVRDARAKVPVSLHPRGGEPDLLGNRDSFFLVDLPIGEPDPLTRLQAVNAETALRKDRHDAQELYALFDTLSRVPLCGRAVQRMALSPHEFSMNISNVPGPREPCRILNGVIDELYSVVEVAPGHALRISAESLCGTLFVSLCVDPEVVTGVDTLAEGITGSVAELRAAAGSSSA